MFKFLKKIIHKNIDKISEEIEEEGEKEEINKREKETENNTNEQEESTETEETIEENNTIREESQENKKKEIKEGREISSKEESSQNEKDKNTHNKHTTEEHNPIRKKIDEDKENNKEITEEKKEQKSDNIKEKKEGFFAKLKKHLTTKTISEELFDKLFSDFEISLLENNVAYEIVEKIKEDLKEAIVNKSLEKKQINSIVEKTLEKSLREVLSTEPIDIIKEIKENKQKYNEINRDNNNNKEEIENKDNNSEIITKENNDNNEKSRHSRPYVICFFGINGSGKTTTIAKIAHLLKKNNITSVMSASDTFRAAAIEQLEEHGKKLGIKVIKYDYGADSAAVAFEAINYARAHNIDVVLIDTAGRLESNTNLMNELKKIIRVTKPNLRIFVGESITGNDCIEQAEKFNESIGLDGIILTKADIDERGGTAISLSYLLKKPILYLGTGQNYDDLIKFNPDIILNTLFNE